MDRKMSNLSKDLIIKAISAISLEKDEQIFSANLIEDVVIKEGHVQISIFAKKDTFQILEKVATKLEKIIDDSADEAA